MKTDPEIKPGTIRYATNKCLEQFLKAGLWHNKRDLLRFISGEIATKDVKDVFNVFKDRPENIKIQLENDDRFILITDYDYHDSYTFGIQEQFIIIGFLHQDKMYYSYLHALYKDLLDEYLPKVL